MTVARSTLIGSSARFGKYSTLIVGCIVAMVPLVVIVMASFKTGTEFRASGPFEMPRSFNLDNYRTAFEGGRMVSAFRNTTIIWVVSLAGTILIGSMAAYAIDRFEFRARRSVVFLFLLATLVPPVTTQVATFQVVNELGLYNTRWSAIVLFTGTDIISIYIFLQFMRGIPRALDEAALLDGASYLTIYRKVIFPLLKPAIATVTIIKGVAVYNEFYIPFLYMPDQDLGVISTSLFRFKGPYGTQWEIISAGVMITIIPTLIVFLVLQRYIYNGFTSGATK
jgi:ABC-type glycerol-3-phosphate transport system permease component